MRALAILDGTVGSAAKQARALASFLRDGLAGFPVGETLVFYHEEGDRPGLVALCPTSDVRLVKTSARRPDHMAEVLAGVARRAGTSLFVFAGGAAAAEAAARLACRARGTVLTDVLSVEVGPDRDEAGPDRLVCRKSIYSGHMVGRFELTGRPWCVTLDAGWADAPAPAAPEHRILSDTDETAEVGPPLFEDLEPTAPSETGGLAETRFLVVAGRGAGSREGVERLAEAAQRMGADFGVSRAVAMNAWAPVDRQVGMSGARTAPDVCLVVGASGAPPLHWGVEKAKYIVAVNSDEQAPIVRNADVALIDDGVAVIQELAAIIASERTRE